MLVASQFIESIKYSKDDPAEYGINLDLIQKNYADQHNTDHGRIALVSNYVKISKELFPSINESIDNGLNKLKITRNDKISFYLTASSESNAFCRVSPSTNHLDIVINSRLIELLSSEELSSVIGHEIAHYLYKHYLYPDPGQSSNETGYINRLSLSKAAEISADRVGLIACGNLKFSLQSLFKNITGLPDKYIQFDYDYFLKQLNDLKEFNNNFSQLYSTHPSILNRIQALIWFSQTYEYQKNILLSNEGKFNLTEVDTKINKSITDVIGEEHSKQNKEVIESLKLWVTISLFLIDNNFSKEEQHIFTQHFGEEKLNDIKYFIKSANAKSIDDKIQESLHNSLELTKSNKENLLYELELIAGMVDSEERKIIEKLSKISSGLGLNTSVTIRKEN